MTTTSSMTTTDMLADAVKRLGEIEVALEETEPGSTVDADLSRMHATVFSQVGLLEGKAARFGEVQRRVRTPAGARRYGQPIGSIITLDADGNVVGVKPPAGQARAEAPATPMAAEAERMREEQAPGGAPGKAPKAKPGDALREHFAARATDESLPEREREQAAALMADDTLEPTPSGRLYVRKADRGVWTVGDAASGLTFGPMARVKTRKEALALAARLEAVKGADGTSLADLTDLREAARTWRSKDGDNLANAITAARAEHDREQGLTDSLAIEADRTREAGKVRAAAQAETDKPLLDEGFTVARNVGAISLGSDVIVQRPDARAASMTPQGGEGPLVRGEEQRGRLVDYVHPDRMRLLLDDGTSVLVPYRIARTTARVFERPNPAPMPGWEDAGGGVYIKPLTTPGSTSTDGSGIVIASGVEVGYIGPSRSGDGFDYDLITDRDLLKRERSEQVFPTREEAARALAAASGQAVATPSPAPTPRGGWKPDSDAAWTRRSTPSDRTTEVYEGPATDGLKPVVMRSKPRRGGAVFDAYVTDDRGLAHGTTRVGSWEEARERAEALLANPPSTVRRTAPTPDPGDRAARREALLQAARDRLTVRDYARVERGETDGIDVSVAEASAIQAAARERTDGATPAPTTVPAPEPTRPARPALTNPKPDRKKRLTERQALAAAQRVVDDIATEFGFTGQKPELLPLQDRVVEEGGAMRARVSEDGLYVYLDPNLVEDMRGTDYGVEPFRVIAHESIHAFVSGEPRVKPGISHTIEEGSAEILSIAYWKRSGPAFDDRDSVRRGGEWVSGHRGMVATGVYKEQVSELLRRSASRVGWDREAILAEVERVMRGDHNTRLEFRDSTDPNFAAPEGRRPDAESLLTWLIDEPDIAPRDDDVTPVPETVATPTPVPDAETPEVFIARRHAEIMAGVADGSINPADMGRLLTEAVAESTQTRTPTPTPTPTPDPEPLPDRPPTATPGIVPDGPVGNVWSEPYATRRGAENYLARESRFASGAGSTLYVHQRSDGRWEVRGTRDEAEVIDSVDRMSDNLLARRLRDEIAKGESGDGFLRAVMRDRAEKRGIDMAEPPVTTPDPTPAPVPDPTGEQEMGGLTEGETIPEPAPPAPTVIDTPARTPDLTDRNVKVVGKRRAGKGKRLTTVTLPDGSVETRESASRAYTHAVIVGPGKVDDHVRSVEREIAGHNAEIARLEAALADPKFSRKDRRYGSRDTTPDTHVRAFEWHLKGTDTTHTVRGGGRGGRPETYTEWLAYSDGSAEGKTQVPRGTAVRQGLTIIDENASTLGGFDHRDGRPEDERWVIVSVREHLIADGRERIENRRADIAKAEARIAALRGGDLSSLGSWGVARWSSRKDLAEQAASGEFGRSSERGFDVRVVPVDSVDDRIAEKTDPPPTPEPEPTPVPEPDPVVVTPPDPDPEPEPTTPQPVAVPRLNTSADAAAFIAARLGLDGPTEKAIAQRLSGRITRAGRSDINLKDHPRWAEIQGGLFSIRPARRRATEWDAARAEAAAQRWANGDPTLPVNSLGRTVTLEIDDTSLPSRYIDGRWVFTKKAVVGTVTQVTEVDWSGGASLYVRVVEPDGTEHFETVQSDITLAGADLGTPDPVIPDPTPEPEPVTTPDPEPEPAPAPAPPDPEPQPVVEPVGPVGPVVPQPILPAGEEVAARDLMLGDMIYEGDSLAEITDIQPDGSALMFDLRFPDGTASGTVMDPSMLVLRVPAAVEPPPPVAKPRRRRTPRTPSGAPAVGRPALYTYQRRMIVEYGFDLDANASDITREAADAVRNRRPLTQEQARALAAALRSQAASEKPRRAGALLRAAGKFDLLDANIDLDARRGTTSTAVRRLQVGQRVRIPEYAMKAPIDGEVMEIRRQQGGRILTLVIVDDNGDRHERMLLSGTHVEGLAVRVQPVVVDPDPEPDPEVVEPEPTPDPTPEPIPDNESAFEQNQREQREKLGLDKRWTVGLAYGWTQARNLQPGDVLYTHTDGWNEGPNGERITNVNLPRLRGGILPGYARVPREVASVERSNGGRGREVTVTFTDGTVAGASITSAVYAAYPGDRDAMRERESRPTDITEPTEVPIGAVMVGDLIAWKTTTGFPDYKDKFLTGTVEGVEVRDGSVSVSLTTQDGGAYGLGMPLGSTVTLFPPTPDPEPIIEPDPDPTPIERETRVPHSDLKVGDRVRMIEPGYMRGAPPISRTGEILSIEAAPRDLEDGSNNTRFVLRLDNGEEVGVRHTVRIPAESDRADVYQAFRLATVDGFPRQVKQDDVKPGDRIRIFSTVTGQDTYGQVTAVEPEQGEDEDGNALPGAMLTFLPDGQKAEDSFGLFGDDTVTLLERDDDPERVARRLAEEKIQRQAAELARGIDGVVDVALGQTERWAVWDQGNSQPSYIAELLTSGGRRDMIINNSVRDIEVRQIAQALYGLGGGSEVERKPIDDAVRHMLRSEVERVVDEAAASFRDSYVRATESEQGHHKRIMDALTAAEKQRADRRLAAATTLARFAQQHAQSPAKPGGWEYKQPSREDKMALSDKIVEGVFVDYRRDLANRLYDAIRGEATTKAKTKAAIKRVGAEWMNLNGDGAPRMAPTPAQRAALVEALAGMGDGNVGRIQNTGRHIDNTFRAIGAQLLDDMTLDIGNLEPQPGQRTADVRARLDWWTGTRGNTYIDDVNRVMARRKANKIIEEVDVHLTVGGDSLDGPTADPVDAVLGDATIGDTNPAMLRAEIERIRAALPPGAQFGKRRVKTRALGKITTEDLANGVMPEVVETEVFVGDNASDGGPGDVALRHLAAVRRAGRLMRAEMDRIIAENDDYDEALIESRLADLKARDEERVRERNEAYLRIQKRRLMGAPWETLASLEKALDDADLGRAPLPAKYDGNTPEAQSARIALRALANRIRVEQEDWTVENRYAARSRDIQDEAHALRERRRKRVEEVKRLRVDAAKQALAAVRDVGRKDGVKGITYKQTRGEAIAAMDWAQDHYPTDWLAQVGDGAFGIKITERGQYREWKREIDLSRRSSAMTDIPEMGGVAIHEIGHHMELSVPGLLAAEAAFHWDRTSEGPVGMRVREGKNATRVIGGRKKETGRENGYRNHYTGREYGGSAYEVFTTGVESVLAGAYYAENDPDFEAFILGTLAIL